MKLTATHNDGECWDCLQLLAALAYVTTETCAKFPSGSACVAFAEFDQREEAE